MIKKLRLMSGSTIAANLDAIAKISPSGKIRRDKVSSDEITVRVGQHVNKGDQLGMFHFGGSTHVLLFRPETKVEFNLHDQEPSLGSSNIKVREEIARVK